MKNIIALYNNPYNLLLLLKSYGLVFLGSLVLAIGYVVFIVPHHIVPGGIFGLSIVINHLGGLSVGTIALLINIPLLLWGAKVLGKETGIKTAFSMVMVSVLIDGISVLTGGRIYVNDVLVSSIFGGILIGLAVFIVMGAGATTGGNDILVRIISRWVKLPYSSLILIVDGVVVLLGTYVFEDFTMAAYCIIAIVSISKTIDHFLKKSNQNQTVLVFSKKNNSIKKELESHESVNKRILKLIHHDSNEKMILVTNANKPIHTIEELIYKVDSDAYISVLDSNYRV